jgi:putative transposase
MADTKKKGLKEGIMAINDHLIDELLSDYEKPEDLLGEHGILKDLTKRLLERALEGEMSAHLGYEKHGAPAGKKQKNTRNGHSQKNLKGDFGELALKVPRDRQSAFDPQIVRKGQTRFTGFDDKIISMYARGMTTREIQGHLEEIYQVEVSPALISNVTAAVMDEVKAWQARPLDPIYPIVYFDALRGKVRDDGHIKNKAVYLALGIGMDGRKELLGLWIAENEGAKFWLAVLTELNNRGVKDIFITCVDGLKGFPEAVESVFPQTKVQLCIVHMVRHSLKYVSFKDRRAVASDLKEIYRSATKDEASLKLLEFAEKWDGQYPSISKSWQRNWEAIIPFFDYPPEIRKVIYTTNAIESLNRSLRKISKNRGVFPNDDSLIKLFYLALKNISKKWTMPIRNWTAAMNRFAIEFEERLEMK